MARINLSIPDETKEQMDRFTGENWSKVAQDAFVTRLNILKLKGIDMEAAGIERLRASKAKNAEREYAQYFEEGKQWALESAEYDEARRVADLDDVGDCFTADSVVASILGDLGIDSHLRRVTKETIFGTLEPSDEAVSGFVAGVTAVINQV